MKILLLHTGNEMLKRTFAEYDAAAKAVFSPAAKNKEDRIREIRKLKASLELMMKAQHRVNPVQIMPDEWFDNIEPMALQLRLKNGWYPVEELKALVERIDRKSNVELIDRFDQYLASVPRGHDILIWNTGEEEVDAILSH